jgi:hypothetical protein
MIIENRVLWGIAPCGSVISFRRFEETYHIYLQGHTWIITPKMKTIRSFETSANHYLTTQRINPEELHPQCDSSFATYKSFTATSFPGGNVPQAARLTSAIFFAVVVLVLSFACYTYNWTSGCAVGCMTSSSREFKGTLLGKNTAFSLCACVCHHTHTHTTQRPDMAVTVPQHMCLRYTICV